MSVTAIRLNLNGLRIDDVINLLVTCGFVVVASVDSINFSFSVVAFTRLVLAIVGVIVIVIYAPVKVVVGRMLRLIKTSQF
jgi:hypothetical protein